MPSYSVLTVRFISPKLGDYCESDLIAEDLVEAEKILRASKEDPQRLEQLAQRFVASRSDFVARYAPRALTDGSIAVAELSNEQHKQYVQSMNLTLLWSICQRSELRVLVPGFHLDAHGYVIARVPRSALDTAPEEYLFDL